MPTGLNAVLVTCISCLSIALTDEEWAFLGHSLFQSIMHDNTVLIIGYLLEGVLFLC